MTAARQPVTQIVSQPTIRYVLRIGIRIRAGERSIQSKERLPSVTDGFHGSEPQYVECAVAVVLVGQLCHHVRAVRQRLL
jgi:hypothetical protein